MTAPVRPPEWHYAEADRLLRELADDRRDPELGCVKHALGRAQVHAALAQCGCLFPEALDEDTYRGVVTVCTTGDRL